MFVFNFKISKKKFFRIFIPLTVTLFILIFALSINSIYFGAKESISEMPNNIIELDSNNYTSFLKDCHENTDSYIGYKIKVTGYIYRLPDFADNQFVVARTMLYNQNSQAVVVGILCQTDAVKDYEDYAWVTIEGTIEKGNYNGDIPIVNVDSLIRSRMPPNEFVYEPID